MTIFSLFARDRAMSSGSLPPASPVSSAASSAVTARDDDALSVASGFFSDVDDADEVDCASDDAVAGAADDDDNSATDTATASDEGAASVETTGSANSTAGADLHRLCTMGSTNLPAGAGLTDPMHTDGIGNDVAQGVTGVDDTVHAVHDDTFQDDQDILFQDGIHDDGIDTCPDFDDSIFDPTLLVPATDDCPVFDTANCETDLPVPDALPGHVQVTSNNDQASHVQDAANSPVQDQVSAARVATSTRLALVPGSTSEPPGSRQPVDTTVAATSLATDVPAAPSLATLSVFAHNAAVFRCIACSFAAPQLAELRAHRHRKNRGTVFTDVFHSGCTCAMSFAQRAAATRHSLHCGTAQTARCDATSTPQLQQQQHTEDTPATGGGPTVTRRNPLPDLATLLTSSSRPWLAARSRLRVSLIRTDTQDSSGTSTQHVTVLTGCKRRRLNPSLVPDQDQDIDMDHLDAAPVDDFLLRMMAYAPNTTSASPKHTHFQQPLIVPSSAVPVIFTLPRHDEENQDVATGVTEDLDDHKDDDLDDNNDDFDIITDDKDENDDENDGNDDEHVDNGNDDDDDGATDTAAADDVTPSEVTLPQDPDVAMPDPDPESAAWTMFFDGAFRPRSRQHGAGAGAGATLFKAQ
ncbi:unnamed protein product [Hyaloperonospora brassicae]|uniref:C2H2-type domain-containing protein n=1 Tax=Hyaloperonospora brassicae TaxID=162125 RepID=A0AAV0T1E1_HYABA|nr:unnamed protein product [Hyaloperonospora brassicae]